MRKVMAIWLSLIFMSCGEETAKLDEQVTIQSEQTNEEEQHIKEKLEPVQRQEEAPPEEPTTKECPHCFSEISIKATRCAFCAADIPSS